MGGEPELAVAIHVIQQPIQVHTLTSSLSQSTQIISTYGESEYKGKPPISLIFHGTGHYDLLLLR